MPESAWRQLLGALAAVGLLFWYFGFHGFVSGNVLSLQVLHQVMPRTAPAHASGYRSDVVHALGITSKPASLMLDRALLAALERRATRSGSGWRITASYALLATPTDPTTAERLLALAKDKAGDQTLTALWGGRAAWARDLKSDALAQWEIAFGDSVAGRRRLAEGLYVAGEVLLAVDEAVTLLYLSDCHQACRTDIFEMLRYWIVWQGRSDEFVREMCDHILGPTRQGRLDHVLDPNAANIFARRALLCQGAEAELAIAHAEVLQNTAYVRAVRAYLLFRAGRPDGAHKEALAAMRQAGLDGHALLLAAHTLLELGDRAEARHAWAWTIQRAPLLARTAQALLDVYAGYDTSDEMRGDRKVGVR